MSSDCVPESVEFCTELYNEENNHAQREIPSSSSDKQANEKTTTEMTCVKKTSTSLDEGMVK